jgi:hypothetical protein
MNTNGVKDCDLKDGLSLDELFERGEGLAYKYVIKYINYLVDNFKYSCRNKFRKENMCYYIQLSR